MTLPLTHLTTVAELDAALAGSTSRPILIFKHSVTCGTSALALEEIDEIDELIEREGMPVDLFVVAFVDDANRTAPDHALDAVLADPVGNGPSAIARWRGIRVRLIVRRH